MNLYMYILKAVSVFCVYVTHFTRLASSFFGCAVLLTA